jgi:3'-phosphoadenosine 5'-phosphosulfate sulfotransferase (PAPS reductase)/FAD synthetase
MKHERLEACVKEFFTKYLNYQEESDSGKMFNPVTIGCCRVMMVEPLNELLDEMATLVGVKQNDPQDK